MVSRSGQSQRIRALSRTTRAVLVALIGAMLAAWAAWLNWRPPVDPLPSGSVPFASAGRVLAVEDGDTFVFEPTEASPHVPRRVRVRLHAVDAPELPQASGLAARQALAQLTRRATIGIDCYKRDSQGRAVCRVFAAAADGTLIDVELALLRQGWVWHFRAFAAEQTAAERRRYEAAEDEARAARRGLWQRPDPVPPWTCRERLRAAQACD